MTAVARTMNAPMPAVVSREEWQAARDALLVKEKAHTRAGDALSAERRRLPMVRIEEKYRFTGPEGEVTFADLFEGRRQLLVQHFMYGPDWEKGCPSCTASVSEIGSLEALYDRDITFALIARAPYEKLHAWKERHGWTMPFYSSFGSRFNFDFGVSREDGGEGPAMSVFLRDGNDVYQTYFTTGRGVEPVHISFGMVDMTPYGRQEDWEDSPAGWPRGARGA